MSRAERESVGTAPVAYKSGELSLPAFLGSRSGLAEPPACPLQHRRAGIPADALILLVAAAAPPLYPIHACCAKRPLSRYRAHWPAWPVPKDRCDAPENERRAT